MAATKGGSFNFGLLDKYETKKKAVKLLQQQLQVATENAASLSQSLAAKEKQFKEENKALSAQFYKAIGERDQMEEELNAERLDMANARADLKKDLEASQTELAAIRLELNQKDHTLELLRADLSVFEEGVDKAVKRAEDAEEMTRVAEEKARVAEEKARAAEARAKVAEDNASSIITDYLASEKGEYDRYMTALGVIRPFTAHLADKLPSRKQSILEASRLFMGEFFSPWFDFREVGGEVDEDLSVIQDFAEYQLAEEPSNEQQPPV